MKKILFLVGTLGVIGANSALAQCAAEVDGNDTLRYSTNEIKVNSAECPEFTITLKNVGALPKTAGGHNLVVVLGEDIEKVSQDALNAGPAKNYIPDSGFIAHTTLLGPGETDSIKISTAELKGKTVHYFCTFPGHHVTMKGDLVVE